jgi:hypothetical protein
VGTRAEGKGKWIEGRGTREGAKKRRAIETKDERGEKREKREEGGEIRDKMEKM